MTERKQNLTYEQLMAMQPDKLTKLVDEGRLDDETSGRIAHLGRFFQRLGMTPNSERRARDVFTKEEAGQLWAETATPNVDVGHCPLGQTLGRMSR